MAVACFMAGYNGHLLKDHTQMLECNRIRNDATRRR